MLRQLASNSVAWLVDAAGGVPMTLADGSKTRVAFRCRGLRAEYEPELTQAFLDAIRPEHTVLDIGANVGLFTVLAARHARQVIAFEPIPRNVALLEKNIAFAHAKNVIVRTEVVSDSVGTVRFFDHQGASEGNSLIGSMAKLENSRPIDLPSTTLDALNLTPDAIKIDVEGAEVMVLKGAMETLRRCHPLLFIEVHYVLIESLGGSPASLRADLESLGYSIRSIHEHLSYNVEKIEHWICTPPVSTA